MLKINVNFIKGFFPFKYYTAILMGAQNYRAILAALFLALLLTIQPSFFIFKNVLPVVQNAESKVTTLVNEVYPEELEIKIKNGRASTNVTEPYYVSIRQETLENLFNFQQSDQNTKSKIRLLAIDTKGKADDFERYQSMALLTESSLIYYNDNNINIYSLQKIQDLTINKTTIETKIKEVNKDNIIGKLLVAVLFLSPALIVLGLFLLHLLSFLLLSIAVYFMVRINQLPFGFKNTFRYTSAIAFLATLIWNLLLFIPFITSRIITAQSLLTIIILGLAYIGIKQKNEN